jgi:hypothetical protein
VKGQDDTSTPPPTPSVYPLTITANGYALSNDVVVPDADFCVGQDVPFALSGWPDGVTLTNFQWTLDGTFVNKKIPASNTNSSDIFTNDPALLQNAVISNCWWVSGGFSPPLTYQVSVKCDLIFTNGNPKQTVNASGEFTMLRPMPDFANQIYGIVAADKNFWNPGTWLHLGFDFNYVVVTNAGIAFGVQNAPIRQDGTHTYGQYFITQLINADNVQRNWPIAPGNIIGEYYNINGLDLHPQLNQRFMPNTQTYCFWVDSPSQRLTVRTNTIPWLSLSDSFTDYLMFQPEDTGGATLSNSIPVPMYSMTWSWSGVASQTNSAPAAYELLSHSASASGISVTEDFPQWTNIVIFTDQWMTNSSPY